MEKAVLKTLIYADIFDYPLKAWEVHKWIIEKPLYLDQVEKSLNRLLKKEKISFSQGYYFLNNRKQVAKRIQKKLQAQAFMRRAILVANIFKVIPWVKLVGISGGLAMENVKSSDDIDLFVITAKNRLWLSRILMLIILSGLTLRRSAKDVKNNVAGKFCLNLILEEDKLAQQKKDLYTAHEVLQMKLIWQRGEVYSRYLEENNWAFEFLPNWIGVTKGKLKYIGKSWKNEPRSNLLDFLNEKAYQFQIQNMNKPKGEEKISKGGVYFHPKDYGIEVMAKLILSLRLHRAEQR